MGDRLTEGLFKISEQGDLEQAMQYIGKGADVNGADEKGVTPLMYACMHGFTDTARLLIDSGANVNAKNAEGVTPLMYACQNNQTGAVRLLVSRGAEVDARDLAGDTPLTCASKQGNIEIARLLVDSGADINASDGSGNTPLMCVIARKCSGMINFFMARGAHVKNVNKENKTAFDIAMERGLARIANEIKFKIADSYKKVS